jgi:hypothetical protein
MNENCPMGKNTCAFIGSVAAASAALCLSNGLLSAQAPASPAAPKPAAAKAAPQRTAGLPRTADGHPDLQGTYDVATMTPVERPAGVSSLTLTK